LKKHLKNIGADHVFTYEELLDKGFKKTFKGLNMVRIADMF